jgi:hypothetical protein
MIISIETEKAFNKSQHFYDKALKKHKKRTYLNIKKAMHDKTLANIVPNGKTLKYFLLKSGLSQGYLLFLLVFNTVLEFLAKE